MQDGLAQLEEHVVQTLLLQPLGGDLEQLRIPAEELAGVAGGGCCLHLVTREHPHLDARLLQGLDGVGRLLLQPGGRGAGDHTHTSAWTQQTEV